jgi:hypothetical protein
MGIKAVLILLFLAFTSKVTGQLSGGGPSISHPASMSGPPVGARNLTPVQNIVNINGQDGFYLRKDLYLADTYTIVKGRRVMGIPYLFQEWLEGSLSTPDGRIYKDYKLRYNAQDQTVSFLMQFVNGTDSLEVNEPIKEFTLKYVAGDSTFTLRFINADQYQKGKSFFYEVLLDNENGQLLKTNQKTVGTLENPMLGAETKKYLKLESEYYYYDKASRKVIKITSVSDIKNALHLTEEEIKQLQVNFVDFANEVDVIKVFREYGEKGKKAF